MIFYCYNRHLNKIPDLIRFINTHTSDVRVRFAPSPTGFLHLGGLRTVLYNYLFAKTQKGKFILRIEDTDQNRIVPGAVDRLINDLKWIGLELDEGPAPVGGPFGPYIQSQRINLYNKHVKILLENGTAYHCFCSDRRLDMIRREALRLRQVPKYDNRCRHLKPEQVHEKLSRGEKSCVRFKLTSDCETFQDLIYGKISYDVAANEGDPVIMKTDGFPTYHFANVVDDHLMKISHVLRGVEWQISTPKHILLYRAFNWEPPLFGHLPLLLNSDGSKLSKRQGDIEISAYKNSGIFPQALVNFVTQAGGGFNRSSELKSYSMQELISLFDITRINSNSTRLMPERLDDFNKLELTKHIECPETRKKLIDNVKMLVIETFPEEYQKGVLQLDDTHIENILIWAKTRIAKLSDLVSEKLAFLWVLPTVKTDEMSDERLLDTAASLLIKLTHSKEDVTKERLNSMLRDFAFEKEIEYSYMMKFFRIVLSGLKKGPSVAEMMEILGRQETMSRFENYLRQIKR